MMMMMVITLMMTMMTLLQTPSLGVQLVMLSLCFLEFYRLRFVVNYITATLMFIKVLHSLLFSTIIILCWVW